MGDPSRPRLDQALVAAGLAPSRSRARALVAAGAVRVDGAVEHRPGAPVVAAARLEVVGDPLPHVSRGGLKLAHALAAFGLDPAGAVALDLGASTGGFTQVLLEAGAAEVWAVDVGRGQLAPRLRTDARVRVLEGVNVRDLTAEDVPAADWVVADLSFIPLATALPAPLALARPGAVLVALVKPQFEVGPSQVGKGGIVRDRVAQAGACAGARAFLAGAGWTVIGETESPVRGGDGNREFLIAACKTPAA